MRNVLLAPINAVGFHQEGNKKGMGMKVVVAGSSGLIGAALIRRLKDDGQDVIRLVRRAPNAEGEVQWDPNGGSIDAGALEGVEAVVHLGGVSIAGRRWNAAHKQEIRESRVESTRLLSEALAEANPSPTTFLCASALGFYGDKGDEVLTENSRQGSGYLAEVTAEWEDATSRASDAGVRVCNMRIGVVLSAAGEMPQSMLAPFKLGLGGKLGSGKQYMSWIHLDDVVGAFVHALHTPSIGGPVNVSAPNPVTNAEFTKALARVLSRPALFAVPGFALRLAMGEMAQFALASSRLYPLKILQSGYKFKWGEIEPALRDILDG